MFGDQLMGGAQSTCGAPSGAAAVLQRTKDLYHALLERAPLLVALRLNRTACRWIFGNERSIRNNVRFARYVSRARRAYAGRAGAPPPNVQRSAEQLRTQGYCVFEPPPGDPLARRVGDRVAQLAADGKVSITKGLEEWMVQVPDCLGQIPELPLLLRSEIAETIQAYYRSHFKIYTAEIYRLVSTTERPQASGLWHTDNLPPGMLKVMVYLTDTRRDTGALRVHPRPKTRALLRQGFFDRYKAARFSRALDRDWVALEGGSGTVIVWDSNLVHRGTPPRSGSTRDAVAFKFLPSLEPWDRHLRRAGPAVNFERRPAFVPDDPAAD